VLVLCCCLDNLRTLAISAAVVTLRAELAVVIIDARAWT
jgi:hypothetical protein